MDFIFQIESTPIDFQLDIASQSIDFDFAMENVVVGLGGVAIVENSDGSYSDTVDSGDTLVLPDETINVYVNGSLNQSATYIPLSNQTITITG